MINQSLRNELLLLGIMATIAAFLYITGWHVQVISTLQRGILATGIIQPDTTTKERVLTADLPQVDLDIELIDADGQAINLQKFQGKVLFVNLWATWCPPCLAEMPNIDQLYQEMDPQEIAFAMIATDRDFAKAVAHVADKGFRFPIYRIGGNWPTALQSSTLPTTFVIDRNGQLVLQRRGMAQYNSRKFKNFLQSLY